MWIKRAICTIFLLSSLATLAQQNNFTTRFAAGFVASQVQGDNFGGFDKAGIAFGLGLSQTISSDWRWGFELLYSQKGSVNPTDPDNNNYSYYKMSLNYIEIPLELRYSLKRSGIAVGASYGYLVSSKEENESGTFSSQPFKKSDISLGISADYFFTPTISFKMRLAQSVFSIRDTPFYRTRLLGSMKGQLNTALIFTIQYHLSKEKFKR